MSATINMWRKRLSLLADCIKSKDYAEDVPYFHRRFYIGLCACIASLYLLFSFTPNFDLYGRIKYEVSIMGFDRYNTASSEKTIKLAITYSSYPRCARAKIKERIKDNLVVTNGWLGTIDYHCKSSELEISKDDGKIIQKRMLDRI